MLCSIALQFKTTSSQCVCAEREGNSGRFSRRSQPYRSQNDKKETQVAKQKHDQVDSLAHEDSVLCTRPIDHKLNIATCRISNARSPGCPMSLEWAIVVKIARATRSSSPCQAFVLS